MVEKQAERFDRELFVARALAYLCVHFADLSDKTVLERAEFLMGMGLPRAEAAAVLGTTDESLRVSAHQRAKRMTTKGKKKEGK